MYQKGLLIVLAVLLVACANSTASKLAEKDQAFRTYIDANQLESVNRVTSFRFHGWSSLTNKFMIISSSLSRQYLLELAGNCSEIRWAHTILIDQGNDSTLDARFDSISTLDSPKISCQIKTIYPINKQQADDIKALANPPKEQAD